MQKIKKLTIILYAPSAEAAIKTVERISDTPASDAEAGCVISQHDGAHWRSEFWFEDVDAVPLDPPVWATRDPNRELKVDASVKTLNRVTWSHVREFAKQRGCYAIAFDILEDEETHVTVKPLSDWARQLLALV